MDLIKIGTNKIYEYKILNNKVYLYPLSHNKRIKKLGINYLLGFVGKDIDESDFGTIFELVKKSNFQKNQRHLIVEPLCTEEIIFTDSLKLFHTPCGAGIYSLDGDTVSPQTLDLFIPLHMQKDISMTSIDEDELLAYLNKICDKNNASNVVYMDYQKPVMLLRYLNKYYPHVYEKIKNYRFYNFQHEFISVIDEAFCMQAEATDPDYDYVGELIDEIEEKERLSIQVDKEKKGKIINLLKP